MVDIEIQKQEDERSDTVPIWYVKLKEIESLRYGRRLCEPRNRWADMKSKSVCERLIVRQGPQVKIPQEVIVHSVKSRRGI